MENFSTEFLRFTFYKIISFYVSILRNLPVLISMNNPQKPPCNIIFKKCYSYVVLVFRITMAGECKVKVGSFFYCIKIGPSIEI